MIDNWINLFTFRNYFSGGQKWFLVIFNLIITLILIMGNIVLLGLKLFISLLGLFVSDGK